MHAGPQRRYERRRAGGAGRAHSCPGARLAGDAGSAVHAAARPALGSRPARLVTPGAVALPLAAAVRGAVLEHDLRALEAGLETPVGTRGVKLSGGQVQRAAAARMLVRGAELLVIDDLSSALDVETGRELWERLFTPGTVTCLAVSHRRAALRRADHIVVLKEGRVEAEGTLDFLAGGLRRDEIPMARR